MIASAPLSDVLARLKGVKQHGTQWEARCPAHDDRTASLSVSLGKDQRVILHCHAKCSTESVCQAMGLTVADLYVKQPNGNGVSSPYSLPRPSERQTMVKAYSYTDEHGTELFQACRFEPKTFRQRHPDGKGGWTWNLEGVRLVPYRLPEVIEAIALGHTVWVVEGEKDADALVEIGHCATTNPMGAGKWREEYSQYFQNASVCILPDNDEPGKQHAEQVAASLSNVGARVKIVSIPNLPPKGDVSDWLRDTQDTDEILELYDKAKPYQPDPKKRTRWRLDEILDNEEMMRPPVPLVPHIAWVGRCTLVAAREKIGKSTLARFIAARVTNGGEFLGGECQQGTVLYLAFEEHVGDVARQFKHFRAHPERVHVVTRLISQGNFRAEEIRAHVQAVRPVLVVVDTLMKYASGQITDATSSAQMDPVVDGLTNLAHEFGCAVVIIHHGRKEDGKFRDSTAIGAAVDILIEIFQPNEKDDPTLRKANAKGRLPVSDFQFRFDGDTYILDQGIEAPLDQRLILLAHTNPGLSKTDLAKMVGGNYQRARNEIDRLISIGMLVVGGRGERQIFTRRDAPVMLNANPDPSPDHDA